LKVEPLTIKELGRMIFGGEIETNSTEYNRLYNTLMSRLYEKVGYDVHTEGGRKFYRFSLRKTASEKKAPAETREVAAAEPVEPKGIQAQARRCMEEAKFLIKNGTPVEDAAEKVWGKPAHKLGKVIKILRDQLGIPETKAEKDYTEDTRESMDKVLRVLAENGEPMSSARICERIPDWSKAKTGDLITKLCDAGAVKQEGGLWSVVPGHEPEPADEPSEAVEDQAEEPESEPPAADFDGREEDIRNLLATGKFTVQQILEEVFGRLCATADPEYVFLMEVLGRLESEGLLGKAKDEVGVRLYFLEGADQMGASY
jgi:predicted transcriptional regulator